MKRPAAATDTLQRIAAWRRVVPDMTIRSTFIVGFPGETDEDFEELLDWLRVAQLDRVGCFEYSPVEGAAANALNEPTVPQSSRPSAAPVSWNSRREISAARLKQKVGRKMQVLIDSVGRGDGNGTRNGNGNGHGGASGVIAVARSSSDAPEIDGTVRIAGDEASARRLAVGSMVMVQITGAGQYDLDARLLA